MSFFIYLFKKYINESRTLPYVINITKQITEYYKTIYCTINQFTHLIQIKIRIQHKTTLEEDQENHQGIGFVPHSRRK